MFSSWYHSSRTRNFVFGTGTSFFSVSVPPVGRILIFFVRDLDLYKHFFHIPTTKKILRSPLSLLSSISHPNLLTSLRIFNESSRSKDRNRTMKSSSIGWCHYCHRILKWSSTSSFWNWQMWFSQSMQIWVPRSAGPLFANRWYFGLKTVIRGVVRTSDFSVES